MPSSGFPFAHCALNQRFNFRVGHGVDADVFIGANPYHHAVGVFFAKVNIDVRQ